MTEASAGNKELKELSAEEIKKLPLINCHTHIFTGDSVPPNLGKTLMPLGGVLNLSYVFSKFHWWYKKGPGSWSMKPWYKRWVKRIYYTKMFLVRKKFWKALTALLFLFLLLQFIDVICHWKYPAGKTYKSSLFNDYLVPLHHFLKKYCIIPHSWFRYLLLAVLFIFFQSGRNLMIFVFKKMFSWLGRIPGKQTKEMFLRYLAIGRFTFQEKQVSILQQLRKQYPAKTGFVILPMDMEYMEAGKVKLPYPDQMAELVRIKKSYPNIYPFVFADPRRIQEDPSYFSYSVSSNGEVTLEDCFLKKYFEEHRFSGIKIYPAMGYYPFDPLLLPLWKYAQQKNLPITTHCVRGPIFFRGKKKPEWDTHPVFEQLKSKGEYEPLLLPERNNVEFSTNFTHPLNFLCLLEEKLLAKLIFETCSKPGSDQRLKTIFGLSVSAETNEPVIQRGLRNLKICIGHYGGGDEWHRYFETDRQSYSNELALNPENGIEFLNLKGTKTPSRGKPEQLWKFTDWYSIISSMMLQYENVYADISYILHEQEAILPLLKQTLQNKGLRKKVLYGTDFYVVRNHKSDKNMLSDMMGGLNEKDFETIAKVNPAKFLTSVINDRTKKQ